MNDANNTRDSLTQEASLREVDNLRQQIYRIKGGNTVRDLFVVYPKPP